MLSKDKFVKLTPVQKLVILARHNSNIDQNYVPVVADKSRTFWGKNWDKRMRCRDTGWFLADVTILVKRHFTPSQFDLDIKGMIDHWPRGLLNRKDHVLSRISELKVAHERLIEQWDCDTTLALINDYRAILDYLEQVMYAVDNGADLDWETLSYQCVNQLGSEI